MLSSMLKQLHESSEVESLNELYFSDRREMAGRPWVMINMISSLDGGTAVNGRSSSIGSGDDTSVFRAIRAVPDVILVGAGTVSAEDYRPVTLDDERGALRRAAGRPDTPTLAIVSGRLSVDPEARVFSDPDHKPLLITSTEASPAKLAMIGDAADIAILESLDPGAILGHLGAAGIVLIEGGPTLNGGFAKAGLVDEINLSVASVVLGGDSQRIIAGPVVDPALKMRVDRVLHGDRELFIRYTRA
jgi:riboflavin-specific deaminase-like protein